MHTYIGNKKNIAGSGLLLIELGKSSSTALLVAEERKLENYFGKKLKKKEIEKVMTDHWKEYAEFIPEKIHTKSKAETYTVEGYNSILRHFLARLRRKTKCYTKSLQMLKSSVLLLMKYRNKEL
jgi:insertion element IS1 protein InsB